MLLASSISRAQKKKNGLRLTAQSEAPEVFKLLLDLLVWLFKEKQSERMMVMMMVVVVMVMTMMKMIVSKHRLTSLSPRRQLPPTVSGLELIT